MVKKNKKQQFSITGSGLMLKNIEINDIVKVIRSLENRETLLEGVTWNIISQEGGCLNFFKLLMLVGLPLMENLLTPLAKSVLVPLGITATLATDSIIQKNIFG